MLAIKFYFTGGDDVLVQLMTELNSNEFKFESCPNTALLQTNQACVARFLEDNGIYRTKILQVIDESNVKVIFCSVLKFTLLNLHSSFLICVKYFLIFVAI